MLDKMLLRLFHYMMNAGTVSFFGIGMGPSGAEKQQYGIMSNLENFGISRGEKDITQAQDFWSAILSGDPSQISKVLGPEISAVNKQTQEAKKTASEFGNRGGGTNAAMQTLDDKSVAAVRSMISNLTGSAAGALGSGGAGLLGMGESAGTAAFGEAQTMQQQQAAMWNDIFKSISKVATVAGGLMPAGMAGDIVSGIGAATGGG